MKIQNKEIRRAVGTDILIFSLFWACVVYIARTGGLSWPVWSALPVLVGVSMGLCWLIRDTPGLRFHLAIGRGSFFRSVWGWMLLATGLSVLITGWIVIEGNLSGLFSNLGKSARIIGGLVRPDMEIFLPMLGALVETLFLALMATVFALPFAFVLAFLAARNLMPRTFLGNLVYYTTRTLSTIVRSIEALIWAIVFIVWVGIGPFAGMLALMVHSIASLVKLYSEAIENIDQGPVEAIKATGAGNFQVWWYAVVPQVAPPFLAFTIYRWDINVRMATIVGFVGGGGIGFFLQQYQQFLAWHKVGTILVLIAVAVWAMDQLSAWVRNRVMDQ